jgi:hypothetical protein
MSGCDPEFLAEVAAAVDSWLGYLGDGRRLNETDRDLICHHAGALHEADPSLDLGELMQAGFHNYRERVERRWSTEDEIGQRATPTGPHSWREDLAARDLQGVDYDPERASWGVTDSLRKVSELAAYRMQTARRLNEGEAPPIDTETAREITREALWEAQDD